MIMAHIIAHSNAPSEHDDVLAVIRQWEADVADYRKQMADFNEQMTARIQSKLSKIEHMKKLVPPADTATGNGTATRRKHVRGRTKLTWRSGVLDIINHSHKGLTYSEVLEAAIQTVLGKRRSEGDKGFYKAISNLVAAGEIVRNGKTVYSIGLAEALKARGEPLLEGSARQRGAKGLVIDLLNSAPDGMSAPDIKAALVADSSAPDSIRNHNQYIYTVLKQLIDDKSISKNDEGIYRAVK